MFSIVVWTGIAQRRGLTGLRAFRHEADPLDLAVRVEHAAHHVEKDLSVHQKIAGVGVNRDVDPLVAHDFFLVVGRNDDDAVDFPLVEQPLGLFETRRLVCDAQVRRGIERSDELTALGRMTVVDDGYRNVAQHFVLIGQRIGRGVDENSSYDDQYDARVAEYMAVFVSQNTRKFPEFGTEPVCLHDHSLPQYFSSVQIFLRRRITVHGSSRKAARPTR